MGDYNEDFYGDDGEDLRRELAMPKCAECGKTTHPEHAVPVYECPESATWVVLERFKGIYCSADHALDAYLRGYAFYKATRPKTD